MLSGREYGMESDAPKKESRARVLRGNYKMEEATVPIGVNDPELRVVTQPDLHPLTAISADHVRVEYDPSQYGIMHAESMEERELRHKTEIDELQTQIEQARAEIEEARQQGHEAGVSEGLEKGKEEAIEELREEYDHKVEEVRKLLSSIAVSTKDYYLEVEKNLVRFAIRIARRVVGDAADNHEGVATRIAAAALRQASERSVVTLLCHPEDEAELTAAEMDLKAVSEGIREIDVRISQRVSRGSVILETNGGSIDATIETMISQIHAGLLDEDNPVSEDDK